ncbi:MAG TPA: class I SAM-dependent methyltransferase [Xanthobacteraceae bacterium]|jgi:SAM-dependent methyltransferase|nr:class I SAM-dependent methyltransferase [Xanthobacteraceae bacterium]
MTRNVLDSCHQACRFRAHGKGIEVCGDCGLGRTVLDSRAPELQDYVPHDENGRRSKTAHLQRVFQNYLRDIEPGSLLDVGCADGTFLDVAAAANWRVVGIDSFNAGKSAHPILAGRFLEQEFSQQFDAVTLIHSLEHMGSPRNALLKCRSLIKDKGRLLIVVPNFGGWWSKTMGLEWQWLNANDHCYHYTVQALLQLVEEARFHIISHRTYSRFAPSFPEMFLSAKQIFDWPVVRWRPLRNCLYRLSVLSGPIGNRCADLVGQGAEIQVFAEPI